MDMLSCVKCISCLLKTVKVMHCIKKVLVAGIVVMAALTGLTILTENKKAVRGAVRSLKKKVL